MAVDIRHDHRIAELKAKGGATIGSRANGELRPNGLMDYLSFYNLLPTPTSQDFKKRGPKSKQKSVENLVRDGFILTPSASDGLRAAMTMDNLRAHNKPKANLSEQIAHSSGGGSSHLSPLFVEEMMGYPLTYLVLPFLSHGGDGKP